MKILVDIGHPAHVHYYKNLLMLLKDRSHSYLVVARERDVVFELLAQYKIKYYNRGGGSDSRFGKLFYMMGANIYIFKLAYKYKPDITLSFSSPYLAQTAYFLRIPHIAMNDTEHTDKMHKVFTYPFSSEILTPVYYGNDLGFKHKKFNSFVESLYLSKPYYHPEDSIYYLLGIKTNDEYAIIRFVSWHAHHDFGHSGMDYDTKIEIVRILSKSYKVFISSESELPDELNSYAINIPAHRMHDALNYASIFVGESATMASESALLGVQTIYVNSLPLMGYLKTESEYGLLKYFSSSDGLVEHIKNMLIKPNSKVLLRRRRDKMINSFIDPVQFLVWFLEKYPLSSQIMKEKPDYQSRFRYE
jgi:uncharacterized protein